MPTASDEWRELYQKLQETIQSGSEEVTKLEQQYKEKMEDIEKLHKTGISSESALREKYEKEIAPIERQLQARYQQRDRFAQGELQNAQAKIGPKLEKVLEKIQEEQGWDIILKGDAILGKVSKNFDITDEVLRALIRIMLQKKDKIPSQRLHLQSLQNQKLQLL